MIYQIPYAFRSTALVGADETFGVSTVMVLRGNPCLVFHKKGQELPPAKVVEQQLIGLNRKVVVVVADDAEQAIRKFAGFGHAEGGVFWIDTEHQPIIELP